MNTQAVVGANLMILDLATGYLGSLHDSRVLQNSIVDGWKHHWKCKNQSPYLRRWWIPFHEMVGYSLQFITLTQPYSNRKKKLIKLFLQLMSHPSGILKYLEYWNIEILNIEILKYCNIEITMALLAEQFRLPDCKCFNSYNCLLCSA